MVVGNLPLFVSRAELEQHDIVTYSFGDQEALYLRGQWTVHRNEPRVSSVWQRCEHLAGQLQKELLLKVAWVRRMESRGIANYPKRFQSAEGCYSHQVCLSRPGAWTASVHSSGCETASPHRLELSAGRLAGRLAHRYGAQAGGRPDRVRRAGGRHLRGGRRGVALRRRDARRPGRARAPLLCVRRPASWSLPQGHRRLPG